jgi:hypothetical protein
VVHRVSLARLPLALLLGLGFVALPATSGDQSSTVQAHNQDVIYSVRATILVMNVN